MPDAAITANIDIAQLVLYAFWIFFFGLILYLRREDQREGYPLENEQGPTKQQAFYPPPPKTFVLPGGGTLQSGKPERSDLFYKPTGWFIGDPVTPPDDVLSSGVGPASYCQRSDVADRTFDGHLRIVPTRIAGDFGVETNDTDPRGFDVVGSDRQIAGKVVDMWVDRAEFIFRYYEVELTAEGDEPPARKLLPVGFGIVKPARRQVRIDSITAEQVKGVPGLKSPDEVTRLEEDKIVGYFGGGYLYSTPQRKEPLL